MTTVNGFAKRSTGELYDAIWTAEMPVVWGQGKERAPRVSGQTTRLVLLAMAKFTNPTRDQVLGPAREWRCLASVATLARLAMTSERQVQYILHTLEGHGWIVRPEGDTGASPGRPRRGELPPNSRASEWFIRPDRFIPVKAAGTGWVPAESVEITPAPAASQPAPAELPAENTPAPAAQEGEKYAGRGTRTPTYVEPPVNENPPFGYEPSRAPAREPGPPEDERSKRGVETRGPWEVSVLRLIADACVECGVDQRLKNAEGVCRRCWLGIESRVVARV